MTVTRLRAVLLDLDGVLVDSRVAIARCLDHALAAAGLAAVTPDEVDDVIGPPLHDAFAALLRARGADPADAWRFVGAYRERYAVSCIEETLPIDGVQETLVALRDRFRLAVATSKPVAFAVPILDAVGLLPLVETVEGPTLEARSEAKAVTIARALDALGVEGSEAVMVGDRRHDVEGARANGVTAVGVLWGVGSARELRDAGADAIVETPRELASLLAAWHEGHPTGQALR